MKVFVPLALAMALAAAGTSASKSGRITSIDLSQPFGTRSAWQFKASQGADVPDPLGEASDKAPGAIQLCISKDRGRTCRPDLRHLLTLSTGYDIFSEPHFLNNARIVRAGPNRKLLLLEVASLHSINGNQRTATVVLAYDRAQDGFVSNYEKQSGRNNNEEVRYIVAGPLEGAMISAEPTDNAPYAFWITVSKLSGGSYKQALRYRSATRYGDGNPIAVIDSEMPNIEQRLGLWHPGSKLPVPRRQCQNPHLIHQELWC